MKFPVNLVTFTEEILNGKLHFLCNVGNKPNNRLIPRLKALINQSLSRRHSKKDRNLYKPITLSQKLLLPKTGKDKRIKT